MGLGTILIRDLVFPIWELTGFSGEIRWDISKPDDPPKWCLDVSQVRVKFVFEARRCLLRKI